MDFITKTFESNHRNRNIDIVLLIARLSIALMMLTHGIPKIERLTADPVKFMNFIHLGPEISLGLVVFSEVFCSILIFFGLATRLASIPLIITMIIAVFYVHADDPFSNKEMGLHFLLVYLILLMMGSGRFSLDALWFKKKVS